MVYILQLLHLKTCDAIDIMQQPGPFADIYITRTVSKVTCTVGKENPPLDRGAHYHPLCLQSNFASHVSHAKAHLSTLAAAAAASKCIVGAT